MTTPSEEALNNHPVANPTKENQGFAIAKPQTPPRVRRNVPILDQDFEDTDPGNSASGVWFEP
jgi:hypothetical protein